MNRFIKINMALIAFSFIVFGTGAALQGDLPPVPTLSPTDVAPANPERAMQPAEPQAVQPAQQPSGQPDESQGVQPAPAPSADESQGGAQRAESPAPAQMTDKELDELVAPIALYPDPLLAQVMAASTYPLDVVEADRWLKANPNATQEQIDQQSWDSSVKAVARFPKVIAMMSEKLTWTRQLGQAVLNQEEKVADAIQRDRQTAQNNGMLKSSDEQAVQEENNHIVIVPANPQVIYVPQYYPQYVYGFSDYNNDYPYYTSGYDPYYYNQYPYRYGNYWGLWYDSPIYCGGWLDMDFDWGRRCLYYGGWGYRHHRDDFDRRHHHGDRWRGGDRDDHRGDRGHRDGAFGHGSFGGYSSDREWRHGGGGGDRFSGDRNRFRYDSGSMNRVGLTTSRFDRRVDQARISQRLRGSNFNYSGDVRGGNRTNSRMNYGDARISPQTGTRADSRVNRDNFGQVRTGDPGRAGRIAQRDIGQARSSPLGSSLRRSGDIGFRSGSSLRRNDLITPRNNYGRGGTFSQYGNTVAPGSRSRGDLGTPRADFGRSYRMGGMAGGNYNRGGSAGNIRSYSGGYSGGGPMIRSGGVGNFSRGSAASIRSGGGGGGFSRGSASIRSGGGGGGFSRGSAGVRGGGGGGSMHGGGGRGR